jgi:FkbM family methyltransferase
MNVTRAKVTGQFRTRLHHVKLARGHTFISCPSLRGSTVIDGGAHLGEFAVIMATFYGTKVIALEPNKELTIDLNHPDIFYVCAALSDGDGEGTMFLNQNIEASSIYCDTSDGSQNQHQVPVSIRGLQSLIEQFGVEQIGIVKLDVEGAEFSTIQSINDVLAPMIYQLTVEFHPTRPTGEEEYRMERSFKHLRELGFYICRSSFFGYGDVLFLNSRYFSKPGWMFRTLLPFYRKGLELGFF